MNLHPSAPVLPPAAPPAAAAPRLVFYWLVVGLPLGWGICQTLIKTLSLFQ